MKDYRPGRRLRSRHENMVVVCLVVVAAIISVGVAPNDWKRPAWIAVIALWLTYGLVKRAVIQRFNRANAQGLESLKLGGYARAEREFRDVQQRFRWPRHLPRVVAFNRANALLHMGRPDEARDQLAAADAAGGVIGLDAQIASELAYTHALCGDCELATTWLNEATRRQKKPFPSHLGEVVVDLRSGRAAEVRKRLDEQWLSIEKVATGLHLRPLRVLRAFAIAASSDVRDAAAVEPVLAGLRPARYDEFAYLGAKWPEIDQFLKLHLS